MENDHLGPLMKAVQAAKAPSVVEKSPRLAQEPVRFDGPSKPTSVTVPILFYLSELCFLPSTMLLAVYMPVTCSASGIGNSMKIISLACLSRLEFPAPRQRPSIILTLISQKAHLNTAAPCSDSCLFGSVSTQAVLSRLVVFFFLAVKLLQSTVGCSLVSS